MDGRAATHLPYYGWPQQEFEKAPGCFGLSRGSLRSGLVKAFSFSAGLHSVSTCNATVQDRQEPQQRPAARSATNHGLQRLAWALPCLIMVPGGLNNYSAFIIMHHHSRHASKSGHVNIPADRILQSDCQPVLSLSSQDQTHVT
eukprot:1139875-Pelagomonas_calceolata.AAC.3